MPTAFSIFEAAFRSFLMAAAVWAGIRLLRVRGVRAQKLAWALVLLAAGVMPFAMRSPWFSNGLLGLPPVQLPLRPAPEIASKPAPVPEPAIPVASYQTFRVAPLPKPSPAHHLDEEAGTPVILPDFDVASTQQTAAPVAVRPASVAPVIHSQPERFWNWSRGRTIGLTLYFSIAAILLLRMALGLAIALRIWRRAEPLNSQPGAEVRISRDLATPVTIGSTVILPASYKDWDPAKLRIVLAHEQAHIRQRDFYLQILAALHAAAFWFSPLGWWLQRKLSELGEALSDRAGLAESPSPAAYAQILLEFAAQPRTSIFSGLFAGPLTGVPMARTSKLSSRIESILNPRRFRLADLGRRSHAIFAATLVPVALVAVVACIRIVPSVEAAQQAPAATPAPVQPTTGQVAPTAPDQVTSTDIPQAATPAPNPSPNPDPNPSPNLAPTSPALPPTPPLPPAEKLGPPQGPFGEIAEPATPAVPAMPSLPAVAPMPPMPPMPPVSGKGFVYGYSGGQDGQDSFAIIGDKGNSNVYLNGPGANGLEEAKRKYHSNFVWFTRDGKSYVITDPAFVAQCEALFRENPEWAAKRKVLEDRQANLEKEMAKFNNQFDKAKFPGPEFEAQMANVQQQIAAMHLDKLNVEIGQQFSAEKQAEFNKQMAQFAADTLKARLNGPEFQAQIAKLQQQIAALQSDESKKLGEQIARQLRDSKQLNDAATRQLTKQLSEAEIEAQARSADKLQEQAERRVEELQDRMGDINEHFGDIQGRLGDIQGQIGEHMGEIGEKQGEIGERMGLIGEEMGKIGEQQGKLAEQASRKVQSLIDQAFKDGKAKPVQ
jgi:hypothetical protein